MKKLFVILLLLALAAGMTACADSSAPGQGAQATPDAEVLAASAANAQAAAGEEPPASDTDAAAAPLDEAAYEAALACVGLSVDELFAAIGEPTGGTEYAASCEEENAEDGMLQYDGFYVWTVKTETEETVHDVYLTEG